MIASSKFTKIKRITTFLHNNIIGVSQKSYYQVLGVSKTANPKTIRSQFLKKARQLHPDHNPSPEAQEHFKILKQAYQTLRDPQKRYLYDTGISSEGINESVYSGGAEWKESGRKYYENRWYEFKKNNYPDQRDEYYQERMNHQDENAYQSKILYRILGVGILLGGYFGYDYYYNKKSRLDVEREHVKNLLQGSQEDKKTRKLKRYIQERAKINRVQ